MFDAALAAKLEGDLAAVDLDMAVAQGGEPVGAIVPRVLSVADSNQGGIQQRNHGGHDLVSIEPRRAQVRIELLAQTRQCFAKGHHAGVLTFVA